MAEREIEQHIRRMAARANSGRNAEPRPSSTAQVGWAENPDTPMWQEKAEQPMWTEKQEAPMWTEKPAPKSTAEGSWTDNPAISPTSQDVSWGSAPKGSTSKTLVSPVAPKPAPKPAPAPAPKPALDPNDPALKDSAVVTWGKPLPAGGSQLDAIPPAMLKGILGGEAHAIVEDDQKQDWARKAAGLGTADAIVAEDMGPPPSKPDYKVSPKFEPGQKPFPVTQNEKNYDKGGPRLSENAQDITPEEASKFFPEQKPVTDAAEEPTAGIPDGMRVWGTADGKYSTTGKMTGYDQNTGMVSILKQNGKTSKVHIDRLTRGDAEHIAGELEGPSERALVGKPEPAAPPKPEAPPAEGPLAEVPSEEEAPITPPRFATTNAPLPVRYNRDAAALSMAARDLMNPNHPAMQDGVLTRDEYLKMSPEGRARLHDAVNSSRKISLRQAEAQRGEVLKERRLSHSFRYGNAQRLVAEASNEMAEAERAGDAAGVSLAQRKRDDAMRIVSGYENEMAQQQQQAAWQQAMSSGNPLVMAAAMEMAHKERLARLHEDGANTRAGMENDLGRDRLGAEMGNAHFDRLSRAQIAELQVTAENARIKMANGHELTKQEREILALDRRVKAEIAGRKDVAQIQATDAEAGRKDAARRQAAPMEESTAAADSVMQASTTFDESQPVSATETRVNEALLNPRLDSGQRTQAAAVARERMNGEYARRILSRTLHPLDTPAIQRLVLTGGANGTAMNRAEFVATLLSALPPNQRADQGAAEQLAAYWDMVTAKNAEASKTPKK